MHPSTPTPGATGVTVLPEATRDDMLIQWGLRSSAHWAEVARPRRADDAEQGDQTWDDPDHAARDLEELGFVLDGGWTAVDTSRGTSRDTGFTPGARDAGMTSHRGVLHPDEYVDESVLRRLVEEELGFDFDEVRSVYRQGPLSDDARALRSGIDARLLEVSERGNMLALARLFGWALESADATGGARCKTMERAIERAREARAGVAA